MMKAQVNQLAVDAGFDACGFSSAKAAPHSEALLHWLAAGCHGEMGWMARTPERRADPRNVLPGCQTVILLAKSYFQGQPAVRLRGRIARYAYGDDYHEIMLAAMRPLGSFLEQQGGIQKFYVDTGPILERDFAAESGIAWQGKSTMCLSQRLGTWFFLGTILTTLAIDPDSPARNRCGSCVRCIEACPTGAITAPYQLDARRCISYLTIENKGPIPTEYRRAIGDRIYGCDDCLEACPWNRFAVRTREDRFHMPENLQKIRLSSLAALSEAEFRSLFRDSPIYRIKRNRFVRNVCVALGNVGGKEDLSVLRKLTQDPDELVAEHANWAICEIESRLK
ncbi:MAG: tRNA epoxyqueuosine(34) reductase QueG [Verrucomicrobia bacterium]|nr:tRNA epoxyqueuosine(34) reductase QueG [Verrucomicrobiota bacterium]